MARRRITKEERVAIKLGESVSDLTLDLDEVGRALATSPTILADRIQVVIESAREEKQGRYEILGSNNDRWN
jgi:hypothetical protein